MVNTVPQLKISWTALSEHPHPSARIAADRFLFIIFADIFFIIISLFQGGPFRGWLEKNNRRNNEEQNRNFLYKDRQRQKTAISCHPPHLLRI